MVWPEPPATPPLPYGRRLSGAVAAAVSVAFVGYASSVLLFFSANGASTASLASLTAYFALGSLLTAVVLFLAAAAGLFARWYWALVSGVVGAPIGIVVGLALMLHGAKFSGSLWLQIVGSLIGVNFVSWFSVTLAAPLLGTLVWRAAVSRRPSGRPVFLVRLPASTLAKAPALVTVPADEERPADPAAEAQGAADEQWDGLVQALATAGADTVEVALADRQADSVFVDDIVVVLGSTVVLAAAQDRQEELADLETRLRERFLAIEHLEEPAVLSGDDVVVAGRDVYVAVGARTNSAGLRALRAIAAAAGYRVIALGGVAGRLTDAATALPDGTVLADAGRLGAQAGLVHGIRPAAEPEGASVLAVTDDTLLVSSAAPATSAMLEGLGFTVVPVDVSAFERLGGGLGRLAVRLD